MAEGGEVIMQNFEVWTAKVPPSVRIFGYLMMKQKLLTRDVLRRMNCERQCVMCSTNSDETVVHLLFQCSYAKRVWRFVESNLGFSLLASGVVQRRVPVPTV